MGQPEEWKMTPLDAMLCSNRLQIIKSLVFFLPPAQRRRVIFLIKLTELRQCLSLPPGSLDLFPREQADGRPLTDIAEQISPYCDQAHRQTLRQMLNLLRTVQCFRQFSGPEGADSFDDLLSRFGAAQPASDPSAKSVSLDSVLSAMMDPQQQALFRQYESMFEAMDPGAESADCGSLPPDPERNRL